jgi:recombination protein RecA
MPIDVAERDRIFAALEKKLGDDFEIHSGAETGDVYRIPFRSPNMNYATEGGIAIGRFNQFWGGWSSFKSRMLFELIAQAQDLADVVERSLMPRIKLYRDEGNDRLAKRYTEELDYIRSTWPDGMECAYYNAEQQYDPSWAQRLGIDTDRLIIVESQTIEDIVSTMEATYSIIDFHAVDSTSNASSVEEQGMKMTDRRMGLDARVWKQTLRKSGKHFDGKKNVGVLINQVATNIRTGGTQPVSTRYLSHVSSMTIKFETQRFLYLQDGILREDKPPGAEKVSLAGRVEADGREVYATVEKSRVCRPFRIALLHARFGAKQFDHVWEYANAAEFLGIAEKSGSTYKLPGDAKSVRGLKGLMQRIAGDKDLQDLIYAKLMHRTEELEEQEIQILEDEEDEPIGEEVAAA